MFELESAIAMWRNDMIVTGTDVRELETHLRESVANLQRAGLTLEEAFLIAARRLGSPAALREAVRRENPLSLHRERAYWIVTGALAFCVILLVARFTALFSAAWALLYGQRNEQLSMISMCCGILMAVVATVTVGKMVARMNHPFLPGKSNRRYFLAVLGLVLLVLFANALLLPFMARISTPQDYLGLVKTDEMSTFFASMLLPLVLAAVLVWMQRASRRAMTA